MPILIQEFPERLLLTYKPEEAPPPAEGTSLHVDEPAPATAESEAVAVSPAKPEENDLLVSPYTRRGLSLFCPIYIYIYKMCSFFPLRRA